MVLEWTIVLHICKDATDSINLGHNNNGMVALNPIKIVTTLTEKKIKGIKIKISNFNK